MSLGKNVILAFAMLGAVACGSGYDDDPTPTPTPTPRPEPGPGPQPEPPKQDDWQTLAPIVKDNCALSGCHASAPFVQSKAGFLNSKSIARISNGSMPPRYSPKFGQWNDELKNRFLKWYDRVK